MYSYLGGITVDSGELNVSGSVAGIVCDYNKDAEGAVLDRCVLTVNGGSVKAAGRYRGGIISWNIVINSGYVESDIVQKLPADPTYEEIYGDGTTASALAYGNEFKLGNKVRIVDPDIRDFRADDQSGMNLLWDLTDGEKLATTCVIKQIGQITFKNGEEMLATYDVPFGDIPLANLDSEPVKEADPQYSYTFAGWKDQKGNEYPKSDDLPAVTGDEIYIAFFTPTVNKYKVRFLPETGDTEISTETVEYDTAWGDVAKPDAPVKEGHTFSGWAGAPEKVTGDIDVRAKYTIDKYTVTFLDEDGTELQSGKVAYGETPEYKGEEPSKKETEKYAYTFSGWSPAITKVTGDAAYTAVFSAAEKDPVYTVKDGADGSWTKGSGKSFSITVKRSFDDEECFSHFTGVSVDGKTLDKSAYKAEKGSTVVTLSADTVGSLSEGEHTVTVEFDDGKAETTLTVKADDTEEDKTPDTDDSEHIRILALISAVSLVSLGAVLTLRKRCLG